MIATDRDPLLNRVQRDTTVVCAALVLVATVAGGWRAAFGVVAGGLVVFVSYRGIKAGIDGLVAGLGGGGALCGDGDAGGGGGSPGGGFGGAAHPRAPWEILPG